MQFKIKSRKKNLNNEKWILKERNLEILLFVRTRYERA